MMKLIVLVLVVAVVAAGWLLLRSPAAPTETPAVRDDATLRTIESGDVVGYVADNGAQVWKGIPFARPPVGELRRRAPQPPANGDGVGEALAGARSAPPHDAA